MIALRNPRPAARALACVLGGLCALAFPAGSAARAQDTENAEGPPIEQSVVLIEVTSQHSDWFTPWQAGPITRGSGSGFLIAPGMVLTNAHVVSDVRQILLKRNGRITPSFAEVAFIAHDADLALLRVDDPEFDRGIPPLELGGLPSLRTAVRTYGYPAGGEKISRTEGVVSRVEFVTYLHSGADAHLAIQTDSAINPGNSGGPVIQDGKVVGVAFQTNTRLNDVGFFIPTPVIQRFLRDIEDGRYDGYVELGLVTSNLFNTSYREHLGLPPDVTGVVVDRVLPGSSASGYVQPEDVITAIDGQPVAYDGTISFHGYFLGLEQAAEDKLIGDSVELSIFRDRAPLTLRIPLKPLDHADRMRRRFDELPEYIIYAGLVFMKLDQEYLRTFGNYWVNANRPLLYSHFFKMAEQPDEETTPAIILSRVLPHAVNSAYRRYTNSIVSEINGKEIVDLRSLRDALSASSNGFHVIGLEGGRHIILDRAEAEAAHSQILRTYGIRREGRVH